MALGERDDVSGQVTTGHEWNGIKELNTPVPRLVYGFLLVAVTFALTWTVLMPSWPGINGYFKGLLGTDQKAEVAQSVAAAEQERATWLATVETSDMTDSLADPVLMKRVRETAAPLFGDNCAACHGAEAKGAPGYPNIAQAPTMWGSDPETIQETIRIGINSTHPDTRYSQMLAFGHDQILESADIDTVVSYVQSLSDPGIASEVDEATLSAGKEIFLGNCASCHGEDAKGMVDTGAPNLTDRFWTYGGDRKTVRQTVFFGRQGQMPTWEGRLTPIQIKLLALYVSDMRRN